MSLQDITEVDTGRKGRKRVGRGSGSGLGKTAGRGQKGQTSRAGSGPHPLFEGGQFPFWMRLPKRGFSNVNHTKRFQPVLLQRVLDRVQGDSIDPEALVAAGLARKGEPVKITTGVDVGRAITLKVHRVTASVRTAVEAAGGSVEELDVRR